MAGSGKGKASTPGLSGLPYGSLASQSTANTFKAVAQEFVRKRGVKWGDSHRKHFVRFLENDCYPDIGDLPIATLGPAHMLAVLRKVEEREAYSVAQRKVLEIMVARDGVRTPTSSVY